MELRDIEIFLTLAEELHFGRTAQRLHLSQARVSQSIKKQERDVGTPLFDRSTRSVTLTPVGEQLRDDLRPIYRGLRESVERASLAARGKTEVLRIGTIASNAYDLGPFWTGFRSRHPEWDLRVQHNPFIDAFRAVRAGEIDILISWFPVEEPDLVAGPIIFTEPRVVMVAASHVLATRGRISREDLADFTVLGTALPEYWEDAVSPFYTPKGRQIPRDNAPRDWDDLTFKVANGQHVQPVHMHALRYHARPDITYLHLHDAPHARWGLVWRADAESPMIRAFAQVVRDLGAASL